MFLGRLLQKEGPMYDKIFCTVLVSQKGCLSFAKLFLRLFFSTEQIQRFHSDKKGSFLLTNLKAITFMHW